MSYIYESTHSGEELDKAIDFMNLHEGKVNEGLDTLDEALRRNEQNVEQGLATLTEAYQKWKEDLEKTGGKAENVKTNDGGNVEEKLSELEIGLDANMENVQKALSTNTSVVDTIEYRIGQYPQTLLGHGAPTSAERPINLGNDANTGLPLPWLGTPEFVGQFYINIDAADGGLYYSVPTFDSYGNITSLKWCNA